MFKSGNLVVDAFSRIMVFIPLLPVIGIVVKKAWRQDSLNFLMIFCLLWFIQQFSGIILPLPDDYLPAVNNIFLLLETLVYIQVFRSLFKGLARDLLRIFAFCFFSSLITFYLVRGLDRHNLILSLAQYIFIIALVAYCLPLLVRENELGILQTPLFWIAIGTAFFYCILILMEIAGPVYGQLPNKNLSAERLAILTIADGIRFLFYIIAVMVHPPPNPGRSRMPD